MNSFALVIAMFFSTPAHAESSKLIKVDLDVDSTVLVKAELDQADWYYWIDKNACLCWVGGKAGGTHPVASIFDCDKLKAHPKLAEHVTKCGRSPASETVSSAAPVVAPESLKKSNSSSDEDESEEHEMPTASQRR